MANLKVRGQWLVDEENKIAYRTLAQWREYFGKDFNRIWIYDQSGYGIPETEYGEYENKLFRTANADLGLPQLVEKGR